jgi:histone-lysine N-methyltransferase SETMAR
LPLGISTVEIHRELKLALGDLSPSYQTVARWEHFFKNGRESVKDDPRSGRPVTTCTKQNIDQVRQLIDENSHISYNQIEAETSINKCSIHEIIHTHLKMRKITSRWVPHYLTEKNRQDRVNI